MMTHWFRSTALASALACVAFVCTARQSAAQNRRPIELGVGLGYKLPLANRLATRFEVNYMHGFETNDIDSSNDIGLHLGLSFFTR